MSLDDAIRRETDIWKAYAAKSADAGSTWTSGADVEAEVSQDDEDLDQYFTLCKRQDGKLEIVILSLDEARSLARWILGIKEEQ